VRRIGEEAEQIGRDNLLDLHADMLDGDQEAASKCPARDYS